jgi:ABC-type multidrug transport system fused ATPase/permease subunit
LTVTDPTAGRRPLGLVVARSRARLVAIAAMSMASGLFEATTLVAITSYAVSRDGPDERFRMFGLDVSPQTALGLAGAALVGRLLLTIAIARMASSMSATTLAAVRAATLRSFLLASRRVQASEPMGQLQEMLTNNVDKVAGISLTLTSTVTAALNLLVLIAIAVVLRPEAALLMIIGGAVMSLALRPLQLMTRRLAGAHVAANARYAASVTETARMAKELRVFSASEGALARIGKLEASSSGSYRSSRFLLGLSPSVSQTSALGLVLLGLWVASRSGVSAVSLGAVVLLLVRSLAYVQGVLSGRQALADQAPHLERIVATVDRYEASKPPRGSVRPADLRRISAENVSFTYEDGRPPALEGVSFSIEPGQIVGIVGPSGAGKSTLSELLLGLVDATTGVVRVGGHNISEIDPEWFYRHVSYVPQESQLVSGTIGQNIAFFRPLAHERLVAASRGAQLLSEIEQLPDGFDTELGELGGAMSGGQRQRIAIARALYGEPHLILFDESTSALDPISERGFHSTIDQLRGHVTVVIVTHRVTTIGVCDSVLVLEGGRLVAIGRPEIVLQQSSFVRRALQPGGESASLMPERPDPFM